MTRISRSTGEIEREGQGLLRNALYALAKDERSITKEKNATTVVLKSRTSATCATSSADDDPGALTCDSIVSTSLSLAEVDGVTGSASDGDGARLLVELYCAGGASARRVEAFASSKIAGHADVTINASGAVGPVEDMHDS